VEAGSDVFCSTNDQFLRRGNETDTESTRVLTPIELISDPVMTAEIQPLDKINEEALQLLMNELGVANTARFIQQFKAGTRNYTEERKELLKDWTLDDVLKETKRRRRSRNAQPSASPGSDLSG
jgi:hypothetical protein